MNDTDWNKVMEGVPPEMHETIRQVLSNKSLSVQQGVSNDKDWDKALEGVPPEMHEPIRQVLSNKSLSVSQVVSKFFRIVIEHQIQGEPEHTGFLLHSILHDSDRGSLLIAASIVDNKLEEMLTSHFKSKSEIPDNEIRELFSRSLQNTALKIKLAFAMGLIESHLKSALSELQRIRSKQAAHTFEPFEITKEMCQEVIAELSPSSRKVLEEEIQKQNSMSRFIFGMMSGEAPSEAKQVFLLLMQYLMKLLSSPHAEKGSPP